MAPSRGWMKKRREKQLQPIRACVVLAFCAWVAASWMPRRISLPSLAFVSKPAVRKQSPTHEDAGRLDAAEVLGRGISSVTARKALEMEAGSPEFMPIPLEGEQQPQQYIGPAMVETYEIRSDFYQDALSAGRPRKIELCGPIGNSKYAKALRKQVLESFRDSRNLVIFGEEGTNKDILAYSIHLGKVGRMKQKGRPFGPLLTVECAGVSRDAKRLFGTKKEPGLLDQATLGTLVLTDIHCLNKELLPKIAELLSNNTYTSRYDGISKRSELNIIAVTERKMIELEAIPKSILRTIKVPALRVRPKDIRSFVNFHLDRLCKQRGRPVPPVEKGAYRRLEAYDFPGNVAELFGFVERALLGLPEDGVITTELFWPAQSVQKLDMFKINLLDIWPGIRTFLQKDYFPEMLNHGFTKYVYAAFVLLLFIGPQTRDANFGLHLFWAWWWPGILLTYPILGRFWCAVCPFMIYGEVVQRWRLAQGAVLGKWPTEVMEKYGGWFLFWLFAGILVWEECWVLENTAYLSSCLLLIITAGAMVGSWFFERRIWCRHLCPIGGMNGMFAKLSLIEVRSKRGQCSAECNTYACYKGGPEDGEGKESAGCPLYSHPASLKDNRDCVLCMECLKACPHRTVQINLRTPGIDFGFPLLFPVPGTAAASQHVASAHEVSLQFLLLGAVFTHHIPELLRQFGWEQEQVSATVADLGSHIAVSIATLAVPGLCVWAADQAVRVGLRVLSPTSAPPRDFVELAYCYLPLVWLASLAHYLLLGLTEAGRILPVAAKTLSYFLLGLDGGAVERFGESLPTLTAPPDVVAFLQGVVLIGGLAFSSLLLQKTAGASVPGRAVHTVIIFILTWELWQLIL
eukprot:TRINITY_DN122787_c0_g1_i1.p1 TRINITY_DN122787_c0_g1~~TRINITY_DN122787_c0_g1_i1.p1  ORF type:complete len:876 (+),score=134.77 TRINITY_DN122787_c0_g1_i1:57-2630(+)